MADETGRDVVSAAQPKSPIGFFMPEAVVDLSDPMSLPPAASGSADELLSQLAGEQIDRMLSEADSVAAPAAPPMSDDAQPIASPIVAPAAAVKGDPAVESAEQTVLATPLPEIDAPPGSANDSAMIRALELINAPLAASPAWLRDLIGTVAILTFINAMGVIVFVIFFRHR